MLNELWHVAACLKRAGVRPDSVDTRIQRPGKSKDALRIRLAAGGRVSGIEKIDGSRMPDHWTIRDGQQNSFPYIQGEPSYGENQSLCEEWDQLRTRKTGSASQLLEFIERATCESPSGALIKGLVKLAAKVDERRKELGPNCPQSITALYDRFSQACIEDPQARAFVQSVHQEISNRVQSGDLSAILAGDSLCGRPDRKGSERENVVAWYFDWDGPNPISDPVTVSALSKSLGSVGVEERSGTCALTGSRGRVLAGPFAETNLPVIGKTRVFSMFKEAHCHDRYGRFGSDSYPASSRANQEATDALKWLCSPGRKGRTWEGVPAGKSTVTGGRKKETKDLLLVFLEDRPDAEIGAAHAFGSGGDEDAPAAEASFEAAAQVFLEALAGNGGPAQSSLLRLLVLRKVDDGRQQAVMNTAVELTRATTATRERIDGARNLPSYFLCIGADRDSRGPICPFPAAPVQILQKQWIRRGNEWVLATTCTLKDAYDLFLAPPRSNSPAAIKCLRLALARLEPLVLGFAHSRRRSEAEALHARDFEKNWRKPAGRELLLALGLFGVLLHKLDRSKEEYMASATFKLGQFLALADTVHMEYCRHVRGNKLPPQLIGNALFQTAATSPEAGLARLSDRLRIYLGWARTSEGDGVGLAKWAVAQAGRIGRELSRLGLPKLSTDRDRAELLLGYVAGVGKDERGDAAEPLVQGEPMVTGGEDDE